MNIESISTTLIRHASAGDPVANNRLMELSKEILLRIANRELNHNHEKANVDDLVQETLAVVLKIMATENLRLKYRSKSFIMLLKSCLRKVTANHFRKKQVIAPGGTDNHNNLINLADRIDDNIETVAEKRDWVEVLFKMTDLNVDQCMILELLYFNGKTVSDVAAQMGWSESKVWKDKSRALKKIRDYIGED